MIFFDTNYLLFVFLPTAALAGLASMWVKSAFARAKKIPVSSGLSGAEAAQHILNNYGITNVRIEPIKSLLGDHYSPKEKVLRLSPDVYNGRSIAAVGIAAHEVGHALQDAKNYTPLTIRNGIVPLASVGSSLSFIMIFAGMLLHMSSLAIIGVFLFGAVVLFQLINLPVEFNASSRARAILVSSGIVTQSEDAEVGKVLNAAAMTYVAATITAVVHLLYYALLIFGGGRD